MNFINTYKQWPEIATLAKDFHEYSKIETTNKTRDLIFLESFFTSTKLQELLSEVTTKNIDDITFFSQKKFSTEYNHYLSFLQINNESNTLFSNVYLEDITARLVLFTETLKENFGGHPRNIAFVLEGNTFICEYIKSWTKNIFGIFHNMYYPQLEQITPSFIEENQIEIIVTNYSEFLIAFPSIETILIKYISDAEDWNRLFYKINPRITHNYFSTDK